MAKRAALLKQDLSPGRNLLANGDWAAASNRHAMTTRKGRFRTSARVNHCMIDQSRSLRFNKSRRQKWPAPLPIVGCPMPWHGHPVPMSQPWSRLRAGRPSHPELAKLQAGASCPCWRFLRTSKTTAAILQSILDSRNFCRRANVRSVPPSSCEKPGGAFDRGAVRRQAATLHPTTPSQLRGADGVARRGP